MRINYARSYCLGLPRLNCLSRKQQIVSIRTDAYDINDITAVLVLLRVKTVLHVEILVSVSLAIRHFFH